MGDDLHRLQTLEVGATDAVQKHFARHVVERRPVSQRKLDFEHRRPRWLREMAAEATGVFFYGTFHCNRAGQTKTDHSSLPRNCLDRILLPERDGARIRLSSPNRFRVRFRNRLRHHHLCLDLRWSLQPRRPIVFHNAQASKLTHPLPRPSRYASPSGRTSPGKKSPCTSSPRSSAPSSPASS